MIYQALPYEATAEAIAFVRHMIATQTTKATGLRNDTIVKAAETRYNHLRDFHRGDLELTNTACDYLRKLPAMLDDAQILFEIERFVAVRQKDESAKDALARVNSSERGIPIIEHVKDAAQHVKGFLKTHSLAEIGEALLDAGKTVEDIQGMVALFAPKAEVAPEAAPEVAPEADTTKAKRK